MRTHVLALIAALTLASGTTQAASGHASALGKPGDPARVDRAIEIATGDDMRFSPNEIRIKRGQTIRFRVVNGGQMKHEMVLGALAELKEHAALMRKFPEMEHDDPNAVTVEPGKTGELVWRFTRAGNFDFACLVPGHFEAGMRGRILVRP
jgi:uncharacterized cupredoxin-like copper-binding protein